MRKLSLILFFGFTLGIFYTNCTPNQMALEASLQKGSGQEQGQQQNPPPLAGENPVQPGEQEREQTFEERIRPPAEVIFSENFENFPNSNWNSSTNGDYTVGVGYNNTKGLLIERTTASTKRARYLFNLEKLNLNYTTFLEITGKVKAENVSKTQIGSQPIFFVLNFKTNDGRYDKFSTASIKGSGTFDWESLAMLVPVPNNLKSVEFILGFQSDVTGKVWFDDINIKIIDSFKMDSMKKSQTLQKGHDLPALKGTMTNPISTFSMTQEDFEILANKWNANLIRWQIRIGDASGDSDKSLGLEDPDYDNLLEKNLSKLDSFILPARQYGVRIAIALFVTKTMFKNKQNQNRFIQTWKNIATRYKGNDVIWGFDLANEPNYQIGWGGTDNGVLLWHELYEKVTHGVKTIDPNRFVIISGISGGEPVGLRYILPLDLDKIIYTVHMYNPHAFTHQTIRTNVNMYDYPGEINGKYWDKDQLENVLYPAIEFQKKFNKHIYVGEFSAIRWGWVNDKNSSYNYLKDVMELFEKYDWDWTYHIYRGGYTGWSVEHSEVKTDNTYTKVPNNRERILRSFLAKNKKSIDAEVTTPITYLTINNTDERANSFSSAKETNSKNVILKIFAVVAPESPKLTAYYLSNNDQKPSVTQSGWVSFEEANFYFNNNISHVLPNGLGSKTIYVWFKDQNNVVSKVTSNSIALTTP